jgi:hypothetical protein
MFTQKISMDCTKEQYEKYLKVELEKMGYREDSCSQWHKRENEYITNCYIGLGNVGNINKADIYNMANDKLTYLGKFNSPLFLALAAMTDKEFGNYGEYWIFTPTGEPYIQDCVRVVNKRYRKATRKEIMAKFGEPCQRDNMTFEVTIDTTKLSEQIEKLENTLLTKAEEQMISLLKSKGYKIFKQTTTLEEV